MAETNACQISVIMAVYNGGSYLTTAIDSILQQTQPRFELIIVNDGSQDDSATVAEDYARKDPRIRVIHQDNQGVGAATNTGIKASCGRYIAIMDADDIAMPKRLAVQSRFLDENPDIAGVGGQFLTIDTEGRITGLDFQPIEPETVFACNHAFYALHHPTTLVRREALESVGLYLEDRNCLAPDYDVFTRMMAAGRRFANVPEVVLLWRLNPTGLTHSKALAQTLSSHAVRQWGFQHLCKTHPKLAAATAQNLLMSFPDGTWFDHKLNSLSPDNHRNFLLDFLIQRDNASGFSTLEILLLRWLDGDNTVVENLIPSLKAQKRPWFAHQLAQRYGLEMQDSPVPAAIKLPEFTGGTALSILIPHFGDDADLLQRIENAEHCCPDAELIVFATGSKPVPTHGTSARIMSLPATENGQNPWQTALLAASGRYLAYLEPNVRFTGEGIASAIELLKQGNSLIYVPDERHYLAALDEYQQPYQDPSPQPKWTQSTLLGRNRLILSGFMHQRRLLEDIRLPFDELGDIFPDALATALAHRHELSVAGGRHQYFVPGITFGNRILACFQLKLLAGYFDSGLGQLPQPSLYKSLDARSRTELAGRLDTAYKNASFCLHWGNKKAFIDFFAGLNQPMQFMLFRDLLKHSRSEILDNLRAQNRYFQIQLCRIYSILYKLLSRLGYFRKA